jgi:hypothetical protein
VWLQTPESKEARFCLFWERENTFGRPCRAFPVRKKCQADSAEPFWGVKKWSADPAEHFLGEKSVRQTLPSVSTTAKSKENSKK